MSKKSHRSIKKTREILSFICDEPRCRFRGKETQQGVCYTNDEDYGYLIRHEKRAIQAVAEGRQIYEKDSRKTYIRYLEDQAVWFWMMEFTCSEELVRLRRDNAILRLAAEKRARRGGPVR